MDDKTRISLVFILIIFSIFTFIYSWFSIQTDSSFWKDFLSVFENYLPPPKDENIFNQYFILGCIMLFGASFHLQKIGDNKK